MFLKLLPLKLDSLELEPLELEPLELGLLLSLDLASATAAQKKAAKSTINIV